MTLMSISEHQSFNFIIGNVINIRIYNVVNSVLDDDIVVDIDDVIDVGIDIDSAVETKVE